MQKLILVLLCSTLCACTSAPTPELNTFASPKWARIARQSESFASPKRFSSVSEVNRYVNAVSYAADPKDVWKSPQQFFADRRGDCEDYVFAKQALLRQNKLAKTQVIMAWDSERQQYHALLLADNLILDNQSTEPLSLAKAKERYEFLGALEQ